MATRKELIEALRARYSGAPPMDKTRILDEFVALTGYHRKHAIRVLREEASATETRARNRLYDEAVRQALTVLWEAADRVCGKRLKALIPMLVDAMERHGHLDLDPVVKTKVLQVSAATIDRVRGRCALAYRWEAQAPQWHRRGHQAQHSGAHIRRLAGIRRPAS